MGGAKISDKIKLIDNLLDRADQILIGGGMANTFLRAQGLETADSLVEEEALPEAKRKPIPRPVKQRVKAEDDEPAPVKRGEWIKVRGLGLVRSRTQLDLLSSTKRPRRQLPRVRLPRSRVRLWN